MAKDDYHVIVYNILSYLYRCLKSGVGIEEAFLKADSPNVGVSEKYWSYIIYHMQSDGLIEGVVLADNGLGDVPYPLELGRCRITPKGIEYLNYNSIMQKVKRFLKTAKEITPFV